VFAALPAPLANDERNVCRHGNARGTDFDRRLGIITAECSDERNDRHSRRKRRFHESKEMKIAFVALWVGQRLAAVIGHAGASSTAVINVARAFQVTRINVEYRP